MKRFGNVWKEKGILLILAGILCVYFAAICLINFSGRPSFYCTDMYTDIVFATKAWDQKSLFPDGWLFGNQLYVVATPALAALFCGVAPNPVLAMAMAAVTMTILILAAFRWMLKAVFSESEDRLLCIVLFMTMGLYFGDSIGTVKGWQLFFTMCAYYACYLLNLLLAFGCYLRADEPRGKGFWVILGITCLLSFGNGIQSLRQTAIMSGPLLGAAIIRFAVDLRNGNNPKRQSALVALLISGTNGAGLLFKSTIEIQQTEIFGQMGLTEAGQLIPSATEGIVTMLGLLAGETPSVTAVGLGLLLLSIAAFVELCVCARKGEDRKALVLGNLLLLSVLAIFAIDVFTALKVREIYYFTLYLLMSVLFAHAFSRRKVLGRWFVLTASIAMLMMPSMLALKDICMQAYFAKYDPIYPVSNYLVQEGYDAVYAPWNLGEDIAIASDFDVKVGFWEDQMFVPVTYLCDPEIYDADKYAYVIYGRNNVDWAELIAQDRGVKLTAIKDFPDLDIYLYTSSENIMQLSLN